jgi:uncharacterized LabA/DUF88 family protein
VNSNKPTAIVYIDGLNLYKRLLEHSPEYKWLDLYKMTSLLLPTHRILKVNYFTSRITPPLTDPDASNRQDTYLRALLANCADVRITFGRMTSRDRLFPKSPTRFDESGNVELSKVRFTEEKGSDVALASRMVLDAAQGKADMYVLISTDADFAPTLEILHSELKVQIGLLSPTETPSRSLMLSKSQLVKVIRHSILKDSQMPDNVSSSGAVISRPVTWLKTEPPN